MQETRAWGALLRLAVGAVWAFEAYPQLIARDGYLGANFVSQVQAMANGNPWSFYRDFLLNFVLPHASIFAYLTLVGNAVIGICLFLGLLTPYVSGLAMLLNLNYALAAGWLDRMNYSLNALLFVAESLIIALMAGRIMGLDAMLAGPSSKAARRY